MTPFAFDVRLSAPLALHAKFDLHGFTALLGRSGAGKTSLLKALAGLIPAAGTPWDGLPPEGRPIGYLPQSFALFPHLSVLQNAAFALRGPGRLKTAEALLADLGIAHLADRPAGQVSGGEAQRAALARALARGPELLLLDEPSAALDADARDLVLTQLIETIGQRGIPALAATHDFSIAALADWIVLLSDGAVIQQGKPRDVFDSPATVAAAKLLGYQNFWRENGAIYTIRAEHIQLAAAGRPAVVTAVRNQGAGLRLTCATPEPFTVLLPDTATMPHQAGDAVNLHLDPKKIRLLHD